MKLFIVAAAGQKLPPDEWEFKMQKLHPTAINTPQERKMIFTDFNMLQSYAYANNPEALFRIKNNHKFRDFILDSGAFTYMNGKDSSKIDWDEYVEHYAKVINDYDVKNFIELDIDIIVGLKEVERLRKKLERLTNKQPIIVWHKSRGADYWSKMVGQYPYCAIGGIVTREIKSSEYGIFRPLIDEAHRNNAKVHGLGFTNLKLLNQFDFDSVDSSSSRSTRFGAVSFFTGTTIVNKKVPKGYRFNNAKAELKSFWAWVAFSNYLEGYNGSVNLQKEDVL